MGKLTRLNKLANHSFLSAWLHRRTNTSLIKAVGVSKVRRCLEIGAGQGSGALLLNELISNQEIIASDADPEALEKIRAQIEKRGIKNIKVQFADATELPFPDNSFDLILALAVIHHIRNWQMAISEIWRVLEPGGKLLLGEAYAPCFEIPLVRWFDQPDSVIRLEEMLEELNATGFRVSFQRGNEKSAFVQLIAEKEKQIYGRRR